MNLRVGTERDIPYLLNNHQRQGNFNGTTSADIFVAPYGLTLTRYHWVLTRGHHPHALGKCESLNIKTGKLFVKFSVMPISVSHSQLSWLMRISKCGKQILVWITNYIMLDL